LALPQPRANWDLRSHNPSLAVYPLGVKRHCRLKQAPFDLRGSAMQEVTMYTTAVCPYCVQAKRILKTKGVDAITEVRIDLDPQARQDMMERTGRRTVPQIYIGTTHVGGCDDLVALDARQGLLPLLQAG
jgi:glutaredoxin 3